MRRVGHEFLTGGGTENVDKAIVAADYEHRCTTCLSVAKRRVGVRVDHVREPRRANEHRPRVDQVAQRAAALPKTVGPTFPRRIAAQIGEAVYGRLVIYIVRLSQRVLLCVGQLVPRKRDAPSGRPVIRQNLPPLMTVRPAGSVAAARQPPRPR